MDELDALDEDEPQAAITVAAAIAATATGRWNVDLDMSEVITGRRSHECNTPALMSRAMNAVRRVMAL